METERRRNVTTTGATNPSLSTPSTFNGHRFTGGTVWSDSTTKPINKKLTPRAKKNSIGKGSEFKLTEAEEISLRSAVKNGLEKVKKRHIRSLLPTFKSKDRQKTGKLSPDKVREILQENQLCLNEVFFVNLGKKFSERDKDVVHVRYEQLVPYLMKIWSEIPSESTSDNNTASYAPPVGISGSDRGSYVGSYGGSPSPYNGSSRYSSLSNANYNYFDQSSLPPPSNRVIKIRNTVMFNSQDEARLMGDLKKELNTMNPNMADLRITMYNLDRDRNDYLNEQQVDAAFRRCGIFLSPLVFQELLFATDRTGAGVYKIETLINYITKYKPEPYDNFSQGFGNNHNPRQARIPIAPQLYDQPMFATPWQNMHQSLQSEFNHPFDPHLRKEEPEDYEDDIKEEEEIFDVNRWSQDYLTFVEALHQADEDRIGFMPEPKLRHLTETYNSVYNLNITTNTWNEALRRAFNRNFNEINLDSFTNLLEEIHLKEVTPS